MQIGPACSLSLHLYFKRVIKIGEIQRTYYLPRRRRVTKQRRPPSLGKRQGPIPSPRGRVFNDEPVASHLRGPVTIGSHHAPDRTPGSGCRRWGLSIRSSATGCPCRFGRKGAATQGTRAPGRTSQCPSPQSSSSPCGVADSSAGTSGQWIPVSCGRSIPLAPASPPIPYSHFPPPLRAWWGMADDEYRRGWRNEA